MNPSLQEAPPAVPAAVLPERLQAFLQEVAAGRAPNVGRFCGNCYMPLAREAPQCSHCGVAIQDTAPVRHVPGEVFAIMRAQRARESWVVRGMAYGGLMTGIILGLLPIAFADVSLWTAAALFAIIIFFYLLSANMANSLGDSLGYGWGQRVALRRWLRFVAERQRGADDAQPIPARKD